MTVEQTVDWSSPASLAVLNRLQTQANWSLRRLAPVAVLIIFGLYEYLTIQSDYMLIAAGTVAALIFLITRRFNAQLRRAALASGVCTYRLDDALHVRNALGTFKIPLHEIDLVRSYKAGVIVQYAGMSTLTLPDGPLRRELEHWFKVRPRSAPGGVSPSETELTSTQLQTLDDQHSHEPSVSEKDVRRGP